MLTMQMLLINLFLIVMFLLPIQQQVLINPIPIFDLLSLSVCKQPTNNKQINQHTSNDSSIINNNSSNWTTVSTNNRGKSTHPSSQSSNDINKNPTSHPPPISNPSSQSIHTAANNKINQTNRSNNTSLSSSTSNLTHPTGPSTDRSIHPTAVKPARNQQFLSLQGKQINQQLQNTIQSSEQTRIDLHLQQFVVSDSGVLSSQARTLTFRSDTNASIHNLSTLATVLDRSGLVLSKLIDHVINQFNRNQSVINNQLYIESSNFSTISIRYNKQSTSY